MINKVKLPYQVILAQLDLFNHLAAFDVEIIGTPPLGIDTENSDIDLVCHYHPTQLAQLTDRMTHFKQFQSWSFSQWQKDNRVYICHFSYQNWDIEIFCSTQAIIEQYGYQHFQVEKRLLNLANSAFKTCILQLKQQGIKTEPAFAQVLQLTGDPYVVLSDLFDAPDTTLSQLLHHRGFKK